VPSWQSVIFNSEFSHNPVPLSGASGLMNLKNIHIGQIIQTKVIEQGVKQQRILNYFDCEEDFLQNMYQQQNIDTGLLLGWCKLLKFDFFRVFVGHLTIYRCMKVNTATEKKPTGVGQFRKNVYSAEIINFVLQQLKDGSTVAEVRDKYNLPKSTVNNWIRKYLKQETKY
jgi:hypothetical protein